MRLGEFQDLLRRQKIDNAVLADSDPNIFYLAGVELEKCFLIVPSSNPPFFIVSALEAERILRFSRIKNVQVFNDAKERDNLLSKVKSKKVGVCKDNLSLKNAELFQRLCKAVFVDVSDVIAQLRQLKTKEEIEILRDACSLTDKIMGKCISSFDFKKELDVKEFLESEVRKLGDKVSFETIVASGSNASMPHYFGNGPVQKGFCVIDFGIRHKGYCSDMTRTIFIGKPSGKEKELYGAVLNAQEKAISMIKDGAAAKYVDSVARESLYEEKKLFIHGLGHHIGVEVHDAGFRLSPNSPGILRENMAVTVEPGIYSNGMFGIRIEDDVLVTKKGCEKLTKLSKDLLIV